MLSELADALSRFYVEQTLILFVSRAVGNQKPFLSTGARFKKFFLFLF
jgi:hypothetical protein